MHIAAQPSTRLVHVWVPVKVAVTEELLFIISYKFRDSKGVHVHISACSLVSVPLRDVARVRLPANCYYGSHGWYEPPQLE